MDGCFALRETSARAPPIPNVSFGVVCGDGRWMASSFAANTHLDPISVTLLVSKPVSLWSWTEVSTSNKQTMIAGEIYSFDQRDFACCASGTTTFIRIRT